MISGKLKAGYLMTEVMPDPDASGAVHAFQYARSMT
jgi:hypothetical protein